MWYFRSRKTNLNISSHLIASDRTSAIAAETFSVYSAERHMHAHVIYQADSLCYRFYFIHLTNGKPALLAVKCPIKTWGEHTQKKDVYTSYPWHSYSILKISFDPFSSWINLPNQQIFAYSIHGILALLISLCVWCGDRAGALEIQLRERGLYEQSRQKMTDRGRAEARRTSTPPSCAVFL